MGADAKLPTHRVQTQMSERLNMKNLHDATVMICDLKGSLLALETLVTALLSEVPADRRDPLLRTFESNAEVARTALLHTLISEHTLGAFDRDTARWSALASSRSLIPEPAQPIQPG